MATVGDEIGKPAVNGGGARLAQPQILTNQGFVLVAKEPGTFLGFVLNEVGL